MRVLKHGGRSSAAERGEVGVILGMPAGRTGGVETAGGACTDRIRIVGAGPLREYRRPVTKTRLCQGIFYF